MSDKNDLESFKIGDTRLPGVAKPAAPQQSRADEQQSEEASLGFNRIEKILENEDPTSVSDALGSLHDKLEAFLAKSSTNRDKSNAQRALVAVERTVDLLDYLFQTKAAMEAGEG